MSSRSVTDQPIPTEFSASVEVVDIPHTTPHSVLRLIWPVIVLVLVTPIAMVTVFVLPSLANPGAQAPSGMLLRFVLAAGVPCAITIGVMYWNSRSMSRTNEKLWTALRESHGNAPWVGAVRSCLAPHWRRAWTGAARRNADATLAAHVIREGQPGRIAFIVPSIAPTLLAHGAPGALLEPEEIGHSFSKRGAWLALMPLFFVGRGGVTRLLSGTPLEWWDLVSLPVFGLFVIIAVRWFASALGEKFGALKTTRGILRAGPGWIDDRNGRRWTIDDSVLIVRQLTPSKKPHYHATLLGPKGTFTLPIARGDGPAFIDLWQRWTTPNPRLELMEPIAVPKELRLISSLWRGKRGVPPANDASRPTGV